MAEAVVADLTARGYLDDAAFARHWVETRSARGYGAARLRAELRVRGVAGALIESALGRLGPEAALERCRAAALRRWPALLRRRPERAAARLRDYLRRRGYPIGAVARVVRELTGAEGGPDD